MSNNSSMIVLGIAAAVMLCGMAAAIIVVSSNDNTMSADEIAFYKGYDEGFAAAEEFKAAGGYTLFAVQKVTMDVTLKSAYEYGYECGWETGMGYTNGDCRDYSMYVFYVENFNSRNTVNY